MVLWETWLESAALGMSTTTEQAGIILAFFFTIIILVIVAWASNGQKLEITAPLVILLSILFFVFIGWFPQLLGSMIALVMAAFLGKVVIG